MPEGRAERAVEALAKSIDGAEHSGIMKGVMAVAQIDSQGRPHVLGVIVPEVGCDHRSDLAAECRSDRYADRRRHDGADPLTITTPRPPLIDAQAVCERPHPFGRRATLRARCRGRSHHGLLTDRRRRGVLTGGTVRRPIAAMLLLSACMDSSATKRRRIAQ